MVIMAGGEGKRLRPLTEDCPKPMIEVGGKPILQTIIERFVGQGFRRFYISVNYRREMIEDHFGNGAAWGAEITYIHEDKPLGTAGALSLLPVKPGKPFVVMNGDIVSDVNFGHLMDFHESHKSPATMAVFEFRIAVPYGVVATNDVYLSAIEEKPVKSYFVNAGIYVLDPGALASIPPQTTFTMPELFESLMQRSSGAAGTPTVFPLREYWIDVGNVDQLDQARRQANG